MGLVAWLVGANHVCVRRINGEALFETSQPADLDSLQAALCSQPEAYGYCMCPGTLVFDVSSGGAPRSITLHHGVSIRWAESGGNLELIDPDAIMDWLSARGITFVRDEYEANRRRAEQSNAEAASWVAKMPVSLRPFFVEMRSQGGQQDLRWTAAIEQEFPDPVERARVLLVWFGQGAGPWNGYASWESVPGALLLAMPLADLLAAIGDDPDEHTCEGAARLFSGWDFGKRRRRDLRRLPDKLRAALRQHVAQSSDSDKRSRARRALGEL